MLDLVHPKACYDKWDCEKRSPEYHLNATMEKFDLDHLYYVLLFDLKSSIVSQYKGGYWYGR
jgi:hypothetical protein